MYRMPEPGYVSLTVRKEIAEIIDELYKKNKKELVKQGIFTKQQFLLFAIRKYVETLEKGERHEAGGAL